MIKNYLPFLKLLIVFLLVVTGLPGMAQQNVYKLFRSSYSVFEAQRLPNGLYRDSKVVRPGWTDFHPVSVSNVGVGLVALCIADSAGFETDAEAMAIQTLRTILGETPGYTPDRNPSGYYRHFIDPVTGANAWNSEYSTIDAAILVSGALFAKEYFKDNATIAAYADELFNSIDWTRSIYRANTGEIYLMMGDDGYGFGPVTRPFNEYMIVAYMAMLADRGNDGIGTEAWNTWTNLDEYAVANYWGYPLLTDSPDGSYFLSDFTIQFPYYYINWATNDATYLSYMENAMNADKLYYSHISPIYPALEPHEWGLGAGSIDGGYHADAIGNHPQRIVSPHIVAGFIPVDKKAHKDLKKMLRQNKGNYNLPDGTPFLWRYSLDNPDWRANDVQGIDYSSMLYGLAHRFLGDTFFSTYNNYALPAPALMIEAPGTVSGNQIYDVNVFPNPASEVVQMKFYRERAGSFRVEIIDMLGQTVLMDSEASQAAGHHTLTEDVSSLPAGAYIIRCTVGNEINLKRLSINR